MIKKFVVLGIAALSFTAASAEAQRGGRPLEYGVDGAILIGLDDPNVTLVSIPVQAFRVGFFMSDRVSIEPRFAFNSISSGDVTVRSYNFEVGALFHPGGYRTGSGIYIRPFAGIQGVSGDTGSDSDGYLGAGVGIRFPFADRRLALRLEGNLAHFFLEGDDTNRLGLLFGLSFFH